MKKILCFAALALGLLITGCTNNEEIMEKPLQEAVESQSDEASLIEEMTEPQTEEVSQAEEIVLSKESYEEIIENYRQALTQQWNAEKLESAGLSTLCAAKSLENTGFVIADFDSDETQELIIGVRNTEDASQMVLLEMYTLAEGVPKLVFCSGENERYYLCKALDDESALLFEQEIFSADGLCEWRSLHWYEGNMHVNQALQWDQAENTWRMGYETDGAVEYHLPVSEELAMDIMSAGKASRILPEYESF